MRWYGQLCKWEILLPGKPNAKPITLHIPLTTFAVWNYGYAVTGPGPQFPSSHARNPDILRTATEVAAEGKPNDGPGVDERGKA
jgi:hypothetical protein